MTLIIKYAGRVLVATAVCILIMTALATSFVPNLSKKATEIMASGQGELLLNEPEVIRLSVTTSCGADLSSVLALAAAENTTGDLDATYWSVIQQEDDCVFTYKQENGRYENRLFDGSEASNWMLVFTSTNASGTRYKVQLSLSLT